MLQNGKRNNGNNPNPITKTDGADSNTIRFTRSITTLEDGTHSGEITYCNLIEGEKNDRINLKIKLDGKKSTFSTSLLHDRDGYSPLNEVFCQLDEFEENQIQVKDLIGLSVSFTTKLNQTSKGEIFCNIKSMWINECDDYDLETDEDEDDC